jgi:hypothetical protein
MRNPDILVSKINLDISLPGMSESVRTKLLIPSPHLLIFIDQMSAGDQNLEVWAELLTEIQKRMGLDPDKVVWLKRDTRPVTGYLLKRIVADYYEGHFCDVRFTSIQPRVDEYFRKIIDNPRQRTMIEGASVFSKFPKPQLLSTQGWQILLLLTIILAFGMARYNLAIPAMIREQDTAYWQGKLDEQNQQSDSALNIALDKASKNTDALSKVQRQNLALENQLEQAQATAATTTTKPAPVTNAVPEVTAEQIQVRPALPPDVNTKDIDLDKTP